MLKEGMMKLALLLLAAGVAVGAAGCLVEPGDPKGSGDDPSQDLSLDGGVLDPEPHPWRPPAPGDWQNVSVESVPVKTPSNGQTTGQQEKAQ